MTQTPTTPDLPADVPADIKDIIATAAGLTWSHFKARHPAQADGILRALDGKPIVPAIVAVLESGDGYDDLVAQTAAESDAAAVVSKIAPIVVNALLDVLAG